jgi:hypothetical protein
MVLLLGSRGVAAREARPTNLPAVQLHPDNPKYFLFRGKPLVLITATEHYGSVINRPFDFTRYLDDLVDQRMTLTRTFLLYRELQTPRNPWSPCKPESPDYLAPYPRTGPGKAVDGEPIYDLDQWNPEYFHRLRRFLRQASDRGIVVELTLFSHQYKDRIWELNPLHAKNNRQGVGRGAWPEFVSLRDRALVEQHKRYARKIVRETCGFDNVYYEVCNEPAGGKPKHATTAEVDAWLNTLAGTVRDELRKHGCKHLIFGTQAFEIGKLRQELGETVGGTTWDAVNIHPHPYLVWKGRAYDLGNFMSKELTLAPLGDFCRALYPSRKPVVLDEDNAASCYRDPTGWTIHRKRAWTAVMNGAHYDYIDFSVTVGHEAGTAASRRGIRAWMKHLSTFIHSLDFVHARPLPGWIKDLPRPLTASTLAVAGKDYAAYLADMREVTDAAAGKEIAGKMSFTLPSGTFYVRLYSPTTGAASPAVAVEGGKIVRMDLPPFRHDVVIRATKQK